MKSSSHHQPKRIQSKLPFIDSFNCRDLIQDLFFALKIYRRRDLVNEIFHFFSIIQSVLNNSAFEVFYFLQELSKICLELIPVRKWNRKIAHFYSVDAIASTLYFDFYLNSENNRKYNVNERF
jgi:hypothetical protein